MNRYDGCDVEPATRCPLEDAADSAGRAFEPSTYYPLDDDDDDGSVGSALEPTTSYPLDDDAGSAGRAFEPSTYYPLDDDDDDDDGSVGSALEPTTSYPLDDDAGSAGSALEPTTSYPLDDDAGSAGRAFEPSTYYPLDDDSFSSGNGSEPATSYPLDNAQHVVGDVAGMDGNSQERMFDDSTPGGILVFFKIKDILSEVTVTHTKTDMGTHIDFTENFRSELIIPVESISSYSGSASVLIYDLNGRLKCTKSLRIDKISSQAILDAECIPSTECFLRILGGKDVISARVECRM